MNSDGTTAEQTTKRTATRGCPICGSEAWRIAYGMVMPSARQAMPNTEFAGCVVVDEMRVYPATGKVEFGTPEWACQNPECRHRWW
ncbi:hypothetical protein [Arthrobacter sp. U41]|uniref:hypothetical protein n=1 Tax=Arthrobacter sp. U41 TaxID=1849032 RepID=UPI0011AACA01|nr:hypothetical protein [Arthrobacter sp. U41]